VNVALATATALDWNPAISKHTFLESEFAEFVFIGLTE
jgi:hypothetical protein